MQSLQRRFVQDNAATPQSNQSVVSVPTRVRRSLETPTSWPSAGTTRPPTSPRSPTQPGTRIDWPSQPRGGPASVRRLLRQEHKAAAAGTNTVTVPSVRRRRSSTSAPWSTWPRSGQSVRCRHLRFRQRHVGEQRHGHDHRGRALIFGAGITTGSFSAAGPTLSTASSPPPRDIAEDRFVTRQAATVPPRRSAALPRRTCRSRHSGLQSASCGDTIAPTAGDVSHRNHTPLRHRDRFCQCHGQIGVAGVQFLLDNNALGAEDTTSPYSVSGIRRGLQTARKRSSREPATSMAIPLCRRR